MIQKMAKRVLHTQMEAQKLTLGKVISVRVREPDENLDNILPCRVCASARASGWILSEFATCVM